MLSILYSDFKQFGCPNCGCDSAKGSRPEEGEYWNSKGVGYDLSGFVKTKKAGERILAMVHEVLGTTECKTFLDYRPSEPTWIQFKFQKEEFDLDMLYPERIMEKSLKVVNYERNH